MFGSSDGKEIVQARRDGFSFNRLHPYDGWESFHPRARELWLEYRGLVKPKQITRIALRYINRIEIPLPIKDFKDFIKTVPEIAPELPQGLAGYFMQLKIPVREVPAMAIITETMEPVQQERQVLPVVFDIDVIHESRRRKDLGEVRRAA